MTEEVTGDRGGAHPTDRAGHEPSPEGLGLPVTIPCAGCERLQEEIADYLGHRTDSVAGKLWAAQHLFSQFEDRLDEIIGEFGRLGSDDYDGSLEIREAANEIRLNETTQKFIREAGFGKVYVNHVDGWQTHYTLSALPVRGWRRRYVSDETATTTRVMAGPSDPGYWEISYWPEGWNNPRLKAGLASGYYRIVPDPLEPVATPCATLDPTGEKA